MRALLLSCVAVIGLSAAAPAQAAFLFKQPSKEWEAAYCSAASARALEIIGPFADDKLRMFLNEQLVFWRERGSLSQVGQMPLNMDMNRQRDPEAVYIQNTVRDCGLKALHYGASFRSFSK
ncbi:hypothetical protein [Phaeovulum sp. W22_SRMD_FR3]|uniref:hypothetical protein n=1 Tax=Phaeovulum sp. W22_SRMD_FR3 TaxID=3240274 RepID=UPI003F950461